MYADRTLKVLRQNTKCMQLKLNTKCMQLKLNTKCMQWNWTLSVCNWNWTLSVCNWTLSVCNWNWTLSACSGIFSICRLTQHPASSAKRGLRRATACMRRDFHGWLVAIAEKITRNTSDAEDSSVTSISGRAEINHKQEVKRIKVNMHMHAKYQNRQTWVSPWQS